MMKTIAKTLLTAVALVAFILVFAEVSNPAWQFLQTVGSLSVFALCVRGLDRLGTFKESTK